MSEVDRFKAKYTPEPMSGCWLWTGAVSGNGYGNFMLDGGEQVTAHRASYLLHCGPIDFGSYVLHRCDNKQCVNPEHLFLGTPKDNTQDMIRKNRRVFPSTKNRMRGEEWYKAHAGTLPCGESHSQAKLTKSDVLFIRSSGQIGVELAEKFGVSPKNISRIRRREIWRTVP